MAKMVRCPVCKESFDPGPNLEVGDLLECPGCSANLRLTKLNPAEVEEEDDMIGDDYWDDQETEEF